MLGRLVVGELRYRKGRAIAMSLGLAAGVALVVGIVGVSEGLQSAQREALSPLSSVGTSIIVTRTISATTATGAPQGAARPSKPGSGVGFFAKGVAGFRGNPSVGALFANNSSILTDLAKLGPAGSAFHRTFFVPGTLEPFSSIAVSDVAKLKGVHTATGVLYLQALDESGTVPKIVASFTTPSQTIDTTIRPPKLTPARRAAERQCILSVIASQQNQAPGGASGGGGRGILGRVANDPALSACLTPEQQAYVAQVVVPERTIQEVLDPPSTNIQTQTFTVAGIDPHATTTNLVVPSQLSSGRWLPASGGDAALVSQSYAAAHHLGVGSTLQLNGTSVRVVGIVAPTLAASSADVYLPLRTLQGLAGAPNALNEVLVQASSSTGVGGVAAAIHRSLPGATILTSRQLAAQVSGSLASAARLASTVGAIAAVVVLAAVFAMAAVLTVGNVAKRVREIGSLRAIGWPRNLVVREILLETLVLAVAGGVVGLIGGAGLAVTIHHLAPTLRVQESSLAVGASNLGALVHQSNAGVVSRTVALDVPVHALTAVEALSVALVGGGLAGLVGSVRAARLAPAAALRDVN